MENYEMDLDKVLDSEEFEKELKDLKFSKEYMNGEYIGEEDLEEQYKQ